MGPDLVFLVLCAAGAGTLIGTFTGLVPGIHVNTAASVLLASYPAMAGALSGVTDEAGAAVLVSCCMVSASAVHSFVDFVPSVFIGAPDPDEALTVLPGHRLLAEGRGMAAVRAAAVGSAVGAACALVLAVPLQYLMLLGGGRILDTMTLGVLIAAAAAVVLVSGNRLLSLLMMAVSGCAGYIVMNFGIPVYGVLGGSTLLFPMLAGLFGLPPLLDRHGGNFLPLQRDDGEDPVGPVPGIKGVAMGLIAGWFPGITATTGAAIASLAGKEKDPAAFISLTGSIGTVTSIFSVVTLSVSGSGRSGTSLAVREIIGDSLGGFCSEAFLMVLLSIAVASAAGYAITIQAGKGMAGLVGRVPTELLADAVLVLMAALVLLFTGPWGLAVLAVCAGIGMIPPALGISRVCLVGCLMVPSILGLVLRRQAPGTGPDRTYPAERRSESPALAHTVRSSGGRLGFLIYPSADRRNGDTEGCRNGG